MIVSEPRHIDSYLEDPARVSAARVEIWFPPGRVRDALRLLARAAVDVVVEARNVERESLREVHCIGQRRAQPSPCRSGCKTQEHASYAECLKGAAVQVGNLK